MTRRATAVIAVISLLAAFGCGKSTSGGTAPTSTEALTGQLTVFAAASLTESFNDVKAQLATAHPGLAISYDFAGSQALVQQIQAGAGADVFASADTANMQKLQNAGLVATPVTFARNVLEIAVARANPKKVTGLADLARTDLKVVLADASVPAGKYARQALAQLNVTVHPVSNPLDVKSALLTVTAGEADATVVYSTDVRAAGTRVTGVTIPDAQNVIATYPIAVIKAAKNPAAAQAFVQLVVTGAGQQALEKRGFLAP